MSDAIIYLEDVTVDYDGFKALDRLNFFMDRRELRVVIGPNGAGKTTLLDVISGRVKPEHGRVIFGRSTDLTALQREPDRRPGHRPEVPDAVGLREPDRLGERRAVAAAAEQGRAAPRCSTATGPSARDRIAGTLDTVGLEAKAGALAGALSHGEKQWLEIGMVMAQDPELLLVDEPVAGLTDEETARTGELLLSIAAERSVLVIEHDMEFVRQIARTVTVLHQGAMLCEGPVEQVQNDPRVLEVYLGQRKDTHAVR